MKQSTFLPFKAFILVRGRRSLRLKVHGAESEMRILVYVFYKGGLSCETCKSEGHSTEKKKDMVSGDATETSGCERNPITKPPMLYIPTKLVLKG